jgi:hypothetical protein
MTREDAEECLRDRLKVVTAHGLGEIIRMGKGGDWTDVLISAPSYYHAEVNTYLLNSIDRYSQPLKFDPQEPYARSAYEVCSSKDLLDRYEHLDELLGWTSLSREQIVEKNDIEWELERRGVKLYD